MSPFAIFAVVLTIAYIIYYGVSISRDLYGKKGQKSESEEIFDVGNMAEVEVPIPVTEEGDGFVIGTQIGFENPSEVDFFEEEWGGEREREKEGERRSDDSSGNEAADKSKVEEQVENIRRNMLEGDIQSEVVMDEGEFEDYLISQQIVLFDDQRRKYGKSDNNESEIRDAI